MYDLKGKRLPIIIIIIIVVLILLSNLGNTFKNDIFSYNNTLRHSASFVKNFKQGKDYQDYLNSSSAYISSMLKNNNFSPLTGDSYINTWESYLPDMNGKSRLEVLTSSNKIVKTYEYTEDFFEDFRGRIKSGGITNKMTLINELDSLTDNTLNIILFNGYNNKSLQEISDIDERLISKNYSFIISPSNTKNLREASNIHGDFFIKSERGLTKLVVTQSVFDELKSYIQKGMKLRMRSAGYIKTIEMKNVYGYLQGKSNNYPPLFISAFYDGGYVKEQNDVTIIRNHSISPSIMGDCLRAISLQRNLEPDRTIIFAFLSGYAMDKEGLKKLQELGLSGNYLVLDSFGTGTKNMLSYNKSAKNLASNIEILLKKNNLDIITKNINKDNKNNIVFLNTLTTEKTTSTVNPSIVDSGKFLLSIISHECYSINFLTGNIQGLKFIKSFIKEHTLIISSITFIALLLIIFINPYEKRN